jgi:hypothetical protein
LQTTAATYAHPSPENKKKSLEALAAVFGGGSEKAHSIEIVHPKKATSV